MVEQSYMQQRMTDLYPSLHLSQQTTCTKVMPDQQWGCQYRCVAAWSPYKNWSLLNRTSPRPAGWSDAACPAVTPARRSQAQTSSLGSWGSKHQGQGGVQQPGACIEPA